MRCIISRTRNATSRTRSGARSWSKAPCHSHEDLRSMRYLPLTPEDRSEMLARVGVADIDALFADIPADKRLTKLPDLPLTKSEIAVERELGRLAAMNVPAGSVPFFVGCGAYKHHIP